MTITNRTQHYNKSNIKINLLLFLPTLLFFLCPCTPSSPSKASKLEELHWSVGNVVGVQ